jgi:hypothetical protein
MDEQLRAAIQKLLDEIGDGWTATQFVVVMGLERLTSDCRVESTAWLWAPGEQPEWQTFGLLDSAREIYEDAEPE